MERFIIFFREDDKKNIFNSKSAIEKHNKKWLDWVLAMARRGVHVEGFYLKSGGRVLNGKRVTNNYFSKLENAIQGYIAFNATSLKQATNLCKTCPFFLRKNKKIFEIRALDAMTRN